ncbi:MAG: hypothetical protein Q9M92_09150 [Enterobacterales bacterium]|nr:hypothetical protein [Enterobacterales bacterium]
MRLKNYLIFALLGGLCANLGAVEKKLAYSKSVGVTIYVTSDTSQWCQDQLQLRMVADNDEVFQGKAVGKLVKKLGALFKRECKKAASLTLEGVSKAGDLLYSGEAEKSALWALTEAEQSVGNSSSIVANNTSSNNKNATSVNSNTSQLSTGYSSNNLASRKTESKSKRTSHKTSFLRSGSRVGLFPEAKEEIMISGLSLDCSIRVFDLESSQFDAEDLFFKVGKGFKCRDGYLTGKGDFWITEEDGSKLISINTRVIRGILFADYSFTNSAAVAVKQFESDGKRHLITWDGKNNGQGTYALAVHSIANYQHSGITLKTWSWDNNLILTDIAPLDLTNRKKINSVRKKLNKFSQEHYDSKVEKSWRSTSYKKTYLAVSDIYDYPKYSAYLISDGMEYLSTRKKWTKLKYINHVSNRIKQEKKEKRLAAAKLKRLQKKLDAALKDYQNAKIQARSEFKSELKNIGFVQRGGYVFAEIKPPPTVDDVEGYYSISSYKLKPSQVSLRSAWDSFLYRKEASEKAVSSRYYMLKVADHKIEWPDSYIQDFRDESGEDVVDGWVIVNAAVYASEGDDGLMPELEVFKTYQCKQDQCKELESDRFLIDYIFKRKSKEANNG